MKVFAVQENNKTIEVNDLHGLAVFSSMSDAVDYIEYFKNDIDADEAKSLEIVETEITKTNKSVLDEITEYIENSLNISSYDCENILEIINKETKGNK